MADSIVPVNMLFFSLYCDIISLISLNITKAFHLLIGFADNQTVFWDFKIRNSIRITKGSDNGDSHKRGPTVYIYIYIYIYIQSESIQHSYALFKHTVWSYDATFLYILFYSWIKFTPGKFTKKVLVHKQH